jgi:hypothetical protein
MEQSLVTIATSIVLDDVNTKIELPHVDTLIYLELHEGEIV